MPKSGAKSLIEQRNEGKNEQLFQKVTNSSISTGGILLLVVLGLTWRSYIA
jgi:hypothetical protein